MENYINNQLSYSEVVALVAKLSEESKIQLDYAENDPTKKSHILNRLCYETGEPAKIYTTESYSVNTESFLVSAGRCTTEIINEADLKKYSILVELRSGKKGAAPTTVEYNLSKMKATKTYYNGTLVGCKYTMNVGRVAYADARIYVINNYVLFNEMVIKDDEYQKPQFSGNGIYLCESVTDTFDPSVDGSTSEMYSNYVTVKNLTRISTIKIHRIPNKFISLTTHKDFIALKETVDGISFDTLPDKPFSENYLITETITNTPLEDGHRVSFDGGTSDTWEAYQVSKSTYTKEQLLGGKVFGTLSSSWDDPYIISESHIVEDTENGLKLLFDEGAFRIYIWIARTTNYQPDGFDAPFPAVGVYFSIATNPYESFGVQQLVLEYFGIKKLDNMFLDLPNNEDFKVLKEKVEEGDSGSSTEAIIDVTSLPTENINEKVFYRLLTGSLVINQVVQNTYTVHCVDALPEVGLPATNVDKSQGNVYFNVQDGNAYGYVDDILSYALSVPKGWYPAEMLLGALGYEYKGVITDILDDTSDNAFRLLLEYVIWQYKDGKWNSLKPIGKAGTGASAEVFNHPSNVASGECSHAEGYNTEARGYCSHTEGGGTIASCDNQHVQGRYNIKDTENKYAHIVGNGEYANRSNAHTLGWDGNAWFAGEVYVGGTSQDDENAEKLVKQNDIVVPAKGSRGQANFVESIPGLLKLYNESCGLGIDNYGQVGVVAATNQDIDAGTSMRKPIVPGNFAKALDKFGLHFKIAIVEKNGTFAISPGMIALVLPWDKASFYDGNNNPILTNGGTSLVFASDIVNDANQHDLNGNKYWMAILSIAGLSSTSKHNSYPISSNPCYFKNAHSDSSGTGRAYIYYIG